MPLPDPWHSARLDLISNCVHAAINDAAARHRQVLSRFA
jgi:hypothetical protein